MQDKSSGLINLNRLHVCSKDTLWGNNNLFYFFASLGEETELRSCTINRCMLLYHYQLALTPWHSKLTSKDYSSGVEGRLLRHLMFPMARPKSCTWTQHIGCCWQPTSLYGLCLHVQRYLPDNMQSNVMVKKHFLTSLWLISLLLMEKSDKKSQMALMKRRGERGEEEMDTTGSKGFLFLHWYAHLNS